MKIFQVKPIFFIIIFKARMKKNISGMLKKMLYTYYHGCYGNIFFSKIFVKNEKSQAHFFIIIFKARIKKNYQECSKQVLHTLPWLLW